MALITRRAVLAAGGTLAATLAPRKPYARELPDLAEVLVPVDPPQAPPDGVFLDADGGEHTIASFLGHGMVINFWATWCQPCIAEIPSLAALSQALAPHDIAVLPLSSDRGGAKVVSAWFEDARRHRPADPARSARRAVAVPGAARAFRPPTSSPATARSGRGWRARRTGRRRPRSR